MISKRTTAKIATIVKNHLCQPDASARKLNAAPGFNVNTRAKKGSISLKSNGLMDLTINCLVN
jgi:hypothetical protein